MKPFSRHRPAKVDRAELLRLLPVPADPDLPVDRYDLLKEHFMNEITLQPSGAQVSQVPARQPSSPTRKRWLPVAVGVAATAAVLGGVLAVQSGAGGTGPGGVVQPASPPASAKDPDQPLAPGTFRYVGERYAFLDKGKTWAATVSNLREIWVPANQTDEWLERRSEAAAPQWWPGSEPTSTTPREIEAASPFRGDWKAACGSFQYMAENKDVPACRPITGSLQRPTSEFIASLPRDPDALLAVLSGTSEPNGKIPPSIIAFEEAGELLETGRVPRDLRTALHQALLKIPGVKVAENVANLDGRKGVAVGLVDARPSVPEGESLNEIIFDPATDQIIGTRSTALRDRAVGDSTQNPRLAQIKKGTVTAHSAITIAVADQIGVKPAS